MTQNINHHNILIITKGLDGGTGTFALSLLKLKKYISKSNIHLLALEKPSFRTINKRGFKNITLLREPNYYPQKYFLSLKHILGFIEELVWVNRQIAHHKPNLILGIDVHANLLIQINKLLAFENAKTILTTHIDLANTLSDKSSDIAYLILKTAIRNLYDSADVNVSVSKGISKSMLKIFKLKKKFKIIYNGIELKPKKAAKLSSKKRNVIISIARFVEQKDHTTLLKAFKLILEKRPDAQLWLISDGPLKKDIENLAKRLSVEKNIKFLGWVKSIYPYLNKSDVFVLSSNREGFGLVLVEAMSQGLPVISTNTPHGPAEILDNSKYGILVSMGNEKELANQMNILLSNNKISKNYSRMALERSRYFTEEKMLKSYAKLMTKLL